MRGKWKWWKGKGVNGLNAMMVFMICAVTVFLPESAGVMSIALFGMVLLGLNNGAILAGRGVIDKARNSLTTIVPIVLLLDLYVMPITQTIQVGAEAVPVIYILLGAFVASLLPVFVKVR